MSHPELTIDDLFEGKKLKQSIKYCSFGVTELLGGLVASGLGGLGVGASTAGILGTGLADAGLGAAISALTGGNPLVGAATGGLGGLGGGLASNLGLGSALGIGSTTADALGGAAGGALGSALTGGNVLTGALGGGAAGYGVGSNGLPSGTTSLTNTPTTGIGGASGSAAAGALPAGTAASLGANYALPDLTAISSTPINPAFASGSQGLSGLTTSLGLPSVSVTPSGADMASVANSVPGAGNAAQTGILDKLGAGLTKSITDNPIQALSSGLGIIQTQNARSDLNKTIGQLQGQANSILGQSNQLESYLQNGQLPPGAQAAVNQATNAAKAAIRSRYAQMGLSGSTMEAQDLASADQQAAAQVFGLADQLYQQGVQQSGLASELYNSILQAQGNTLGDASRALTNYSAALGGGNYAPKTGT